MSWTVRRGAAERLKNLKGYPECPDGLNAATGPTERPSRGMSVGGDQ